MPKRLLILALLAAGCASTGSTATPAARKTTGGALDLAINGDGYFIVETTAGGFLFTRDGQLMVSASAELANVDGYRLYPPIAIPPGGGTISVTADGVVRRVIPDGPTEIVGQIILSRFKENARLEHDGPYFMPTDASGDPITGKPGTKGLGTLLIGQLEQ
ncbi:MAG: hypothetical protein QM754_13725 [Tepidisphaeraceae bacterium]